MHRSLKEAGPYLTLGLELGFTMIAWSAIGYLLDRWLETLPWLTMAGVVIGIASVFIQVARASRRSKKADHRGPTKKADHRGPTKKVDHRGPSGDQAARRDE